LGGLGSGFANNDEDLVNICTVAFVTSNQVLIEKDLRGWKELEYEVVRDQFGNCITPAALENLNPMGKKKINKTKIIKKKLNCISIQQIK
jgi:carbamoyl-phosphate synthase / aspartate carbamoyltransferase